MLDSLLADVAAPTPAPAGGYAAAAAAGFAAALVELAAAVTARRPDAGSPRARMETIAGRAAALRTRCGELAGRELHAYEPVLAAVRRPADDPGRAEALRSALDAAAGPPLAVVETAAVLAELALECVRDGATSVRGDALTGLLLAEAACQAAAALARINLSGRADDPRLVDAARHTERAAAARTAAGQD